MNRRETLTAFGVAAVVVMGAVAVGCGGDGGNYSIDTVIGQPNGGILGSTRDLILFVSVRTGSAEIWAVNSAGGNPIRLTATGAHDQTPAWSPDGDNIVFSSSWVTSADLLRASVHNNTLIDQNGQVAYYYRMTGRQGSNFGPSWSVNDRIAFISDREDPNFEIYTMGINGDDVQRLTNDPAADSSPKWSPDGSEIVFSSNRTSNTPDIFIMNADGSNVRQITHSTQHWASLAPEFSPDGTRIAYVLQQPSGDRDIYTMDVTGGDQQRLTTDGWGHHHPSWSPDGTKIAYERFGREQVQDIWVMNADGSGKLQITTHIDMDAQPAWSPAT